MTRMKNSLAMLLCFVLTCIEVRSDNTLSVTRPEQLRQQFSHSGVIAERPSLFGMPPYGRSMRAQIFYPHDANDTLGCTEFTEKPLNPSDHPIVYMLERGECTFVKKVRLAQDAGATAVIVVDNVPQEILPHMANDGSGGSITIPSLIISMENGKIIKDFIQKNPDSIIEVSIQYGLPEQNIVDYTLWTSALDPQAFDFKHTFSDIANTIEDATNFTARYFIVNGTSYGCSSDDNICGNQCTNGGRYCAVDPDKDLVDGVSGAQVVEENLRQMCIFDVATKEKKKYLWWQYVSAFRDECAAHKTLSHKCFLLAASKVPGLSTSAVEQCMKASGGVQDDVVNSRLESELQSSLKDGVYLLPTVIINGVTYYGGLSCPAPLDMAHCGVLATICSAYTDGMEPSICAPSKGCPLGETRDACDRCLNKQSDAFITDPKLCRVIESGASLGHVMGLIVLFISCLIVAAFVYHRHSKLQMRDELRNIMSQYVPLEGEQEQTRLTGQRI